MVRDYQHEQKVHGRVDMMGYTVDTGTLANRLRVECEQQVNDHEEEKPVDKFCGGSTVTVNEKRNVCGYKENGNGHNEKVDNSNLKQVTENEYSGEEEEVYSAMDMDLRNAGSPIDKDYANESNLFGKENGPNGT